ncbi:MAG: hypothetical protein VXZ27_11065, partial [SAR324 cluster bacterium]|nr:hypothetical protein [SAR324 cluster bacterium]
ARLTPLHQSSHLAYHGGKAHDRTKMGMYLSGMESPHTALHTSGRLICGQSQLPRLEKVPVRMPYPPAPDQGSIFENQRLVAGKSFQ